MTKEELEKEAEEKAEEIKKEQTLGVYDNEEDLKYDECYNSGEVVGYEEGYLDGAEPREKRIEELEQQIEKMKNCHNCAGYYTKQCLGCEDYCNWELRR